jgi:site-specific recombinase XerD
MNSVSTDIFEPIALSLRNESHDLVPIKSGAIDLKTKETNYIIAATSQNTRKAYRHDIQHFMKWGGLLPATPENIVQYLQDHAETLNPRTLARRLTALKNWHIYQGFSDPTHHSFIRKTLTGIHNVHGRPKEKAPALTIEQLTQIAHHLKLQDTLQAYRNNALLQVGFCGALRRSELINIQYEHITFVPEGMAIIIPRSKTDQGGEGQTCAIPYGDETVCAVMALKNWCKRAGIKSGFVFRSVNRHQQVSDATLTPRSINLIIKSVATECKLPDAEKFSGHSLRRGFATCASKSGASFVTIMRHGRWRHEGTVLGYIEEGQQFEDNAVSIILKRNVQQQTG